MSTCPECGAGLPEDARFCPSCAAPVEPGREDRERKLATVVFADLVGSTELFARFEAMGLAWHAAQTRDLLSSG